MKSSRLVQSTFITGTLLLTFTGVLSRVIGFFYRIFLSRTIGAEGLGIYQLIFPVLTMCISLSASGVQTSISKFVAEARGKSEPDGGLRYLFAGLSFSLGISLLLIGVLTLGQEWIAVMIIKEARCASLLRIMSYSLPFAAIHSCINGYYYGCKKTAVPSVSQLAEQFIRVGSVYFLFLLATEKGRMLTPADAVWGLVFGDIAATLYALAAFGFSHNRFSLSISRRLPHAFSQLGLYCIPLTANRVTINLFSSAESILIPAMLQHYGYSTGDSLSVFGILTGMAMPMILFPNVLTGSVSVLLLPTISAAQADCNRKLIVRAIKKTVEYCLILGLFSTFFFLLTGDYIGQKIFRNTLAGTFITTLCWICPFSNLAATLNSILNGLGKASYSFVLNLLGSLIRILFILFLVPVYGIRPYLYGMLLSQLVITALSLLCIFHLNNKGAIAASNSISRHSS